MTWSTMDEPAPGVTAVELNRRRFVTQSALLAASATALRLAAERVAAGDTTPVAVDQNDLQQLTDLSRTLCGGGNFNANRATTLAQLIAADTRLSAGLTELLATPPVEGQPFGSPQAERTAQAILLFWYTDIFDGAVLPDRSSAYYQLTAWQAMYTPTWAICKAFGAWGDAPRTDPLTPANG